MYLKGKSNLGFIINLFLKILKPNLPNNSCNVPNAHIQPQKYLPKIIVKIIEPVSKVTADQSIFSIKLPVLISLYKDSIAPKGHIESTGGLPFGPPPRIWCLKAANVTRDKKNN